MGRASRKERANFQTDEALLVVDKVEDLGDFDIKAILGSLIRHRVEYIIIGGVAVAAHSRSRKAQDIDLVPLPTPENLRRLAAALRDLGARPLNPESENVPITNLTLPRATIWMLATDYGKIDILHKVTGVGEFNDLRSKAVRARFGEINTVIIGLEDLVKSKKVSGRPLDLEDIDALGEQ